jgi:hypothetical protein
MRPAFVRICAGSEMCQVSSMIPTSSSPISASAWGIVCTNEKTSACEG